MRSADLRPDHALATRERLWTARLLWVACHRRLDPRAVGDALAQGADVELAAAAAVPQRITGLLWRALEDAGALGSLGASQTGLGDLVAVHRLRAQLLAGAALDRLLPPLSAAGLEPVVLKGPAVARHYPAPGLRPFDDLDLLLPKDQHAAAVDVLGRGGWEVVRRPRRDRYDSVLVHPEVPELPLELHYGLDGWYERANALRADALWRRRVPVELAGVAAFGLPPAEELVMLCAHAAKPYHGFSRLVWVADLAMVVGAAEERGDVVDWGEVAALAHGAKCATAVAAALALARHAGLESPKELFPLPEGGWRAEALRRLLDETWPLTGHPPVHLRFALADAWSRRLLLLLGYTHGMGGVRGLSWYLRNVDHALGRWRDLHHRPRPGPGRRAAPDAAQAPGP